MAPSNRDRQRAAARARLEREMTQRAEAARRRRRLQLQIGATVLAVVLVAVGVWVAVASGGGRKKHTAKPSPSYSPSGCQWQARQFSQPSQPPQPTPSGVKDVGTPPKSGEPRSGTQTMTITTNLGAITVAVDDAKVPCTAASFTYLASKHFYDNTQCHRLTNAPGMYVLQCGDPSATGTGGPTYQFGDENLPTGHRPAYPEGTLAMANSGPGTNGSQFFIVYKDSDQLDPNYTVVGKITSGLDVVKKVADGGLTPADPNNPADGKPKTAVTIKSLTMSESAPTQS